MPAASDALGSIAVPFGHPSILPAKVHQCRNGPKNLTKTLCVDDESLKIDIIVSNIELFLGLYRIAADLDIFNRVDVRMSITGRLTRRSCRYYCYIVIPPFVPAFACRSFAHAAYSPMHSHTGNIHEGLAYRKDPPRVAFGDTSSTAHRNSRGFPVSLLQVILMSSTKHALTPANKCAVMKTTSWRSMSPVPGSSFRSSNAMFASKRWWLKFCAAKSNFLGLRLERQTPLQNFLSSQ